MRITNDYHVPVLLNETVDSLKVRKDGKYVDATLGGGGHTEEILKRGGFVLGLDHDPEAIEFAVKRLRVYGYKLKAIRTNFNRLSEVVSEEKFGPVEGILFDLGVSSHQLETPHRGFSFNQDSQLDMRMDPKLQVKASDLLKVLTEKELYELFSKLGEDKYSKRLAGAVCRARRIKPIETTDELAELVVKNVPPRGKFDRIHPATRIFQALRIAVNDELNSLREALPSALSVLSPNGRLAVISFHSLEDRIVKDFIKNSTANGLLKPINNKPIVPNGLEVEKNPRSRSAKLRVAEKI